MNRYFEWLLSQINRSDDIGEFAYKISEHYNNCGACLHAPSARRILDDDPGEWDNLCPSSMGAADGRCAEFPGDAAEFDDLIVWADATGYADILVPLFRRSFDEFNQAQQSSKQEDHRKKHQAQSAVNSIYIVEEES